MLAKRIIGTKFALTYHATVVSVNAQNSTSAECLIEDLVNDKRRFCVITIPTRPSANCFSFNKALFGEWWEDKEKVPEQAPLVDFVLEGIMRSCDELDEIPLPRIEVEWGRRKVTFDQEVARSRGIIKPQTRPD